MDTRTFTFGAPAKTTPEPEGKGVVLLNSGGMDSRISAAILREQGYVNHSLYVDWNPRNSRAAQAAAVITANLYCVDHVVLPWGANWMCFLPNLNGWGMPFTNALGLSIGAAYARYLEVGVVATGIRPEAVMAGPDWRTAMQTMLHASALSGKVDIVLPVIDMTDDDVLRRAIRMGVDLTTTHSCSQSDPPCGKCGACQRHARFILITTGKQP